MSSSSICAIVDGSRTAHQVLDEQVLETCGSGVGGDRLEIALQAVPALGAALRNLPVGHAHRTDMTARRPGTERCGQVDDAAIPLHRSLATRLVGMHEQVERVRGETGEGGVRLQPVGVERGAMTFDGIATAGEGLDAFDEVERQLDELEPEVVADHRRPVGGARPALQRETRVDAEVDLHPRSPACAVLRGTCSRVERGGRDCLR